MAGISHMHWWTLPGLECGRRASLGDCSSGLLAYYFGHAAADAIAQYGLIGGAVAVGSPCVAFVGFHFWKKRLLRAQGGAP